MSVYFYKAVGTDGENTSGTIDAADSKIAVANLAQKNCFVTEISEAKIRHANKESFAGKSQQVSLFKFGRERIKGSNILAVTSQLGTALKAGLPLLNCLEIIRAGQHKPAMQKLFDELVSAVNAGKSLSEAMGSHKKVFSNLYLSMVRVGETGGMLDKTITQLTDILQREEKIKANMRNASAYPIFVLGVGLISVIIVITWILPKILATISGGMDALPIPTKVLLGMSDFFRNYGLISILILGIGWFYFSRWIKGKGRVSWDYFKLKVPVLGDVMLTIAIGRFAKMLGALTRGGVSILESLSIVRDTLGNEVLALEVDSAAEQIKGGSSLAKPLGEAGYFPPLLVQIVSVGEQTGRLDELLLGAGDTFDDEADSAIEKFIAIFPAMLILLLALVIGFIIAATLLPIVMMELGGGAL
ncbi:MAG: type II secretion system F family protein [Anaerohalosphaeraceae bacterium]|nr:type II secretion system F family protein [Anaerohalosphaeraceae bacterium]